MLTIKTYGKISMVRISPAGSVDSREILIPISALKEMVDAQ